jgi:3-methyladenine DNA glycosylase AlkD
MNKSAVFGLAEDLLRNRYNEEATVAVQWVGILAKRYKQADIEIFERWLGAYIDNWIKVDDFCSRVLHPFFEKYPGQATVTEKWARSENMWVRRASAVSLITPKNGLVGTKSDLDLVFSVAEILLYDREDLVQKGYGWMLKSASVYNLKQVYEFLDKHREGMPRTAFRYAIEKMPESYRKRLMGKV